MVTSSASSHFAITSGRNPVYLAELYHVRLINQSFMTSFIPRSSFLGYNLLPDVLTTPLVLLSECMNFQKEKVIS